MVGGDVPLLIYLLGISMLIKETIFHTLTSMYLLVLRARNRTDDKSFTGTLQSLGKEIYETLGSKHQHVVEKADGVVRGAEGLIERGKERWHIGREKIVRGVTGGAGIGGSSVFRSKTEGLGSSAQHHQTTTTTTTTTVTEEVRKDLNGNGNATVNIGTTSPTKRLHERTNSADIIKRKLQLRDAGRDRIHEGTIHDGTNKLGRNVHHHTTTTHTEKIVTQPVPPGAAAPATHEKVTVVPAIPTRDRVANWLEHTEKEGLGVGVTPTPTTRSLPSPPPPPPHHPPVPMIPHLHSSSPHLKTPVNTPFTPHGKGSLMENIRGNGSANGIGLGMGNGLVNGAAAKAVGATPGMKTGTFDVSKSRNIMREVSPLRKEAVDWEEEDREWLRRR